MRLAARKRRDPEGDSFEGLSIVRSPPTSRGERRQMRTRYTMYRTASNNNLVAVFGHRSIFYCDFSPFRFQRGRVSHDGERCKFTSLQGCFYFMSTRYRSISDTVLVDVFDQIRNMNMKISSDILWIYSVKSKINSNLLLTFLIFLLELNTKFFYLY